MLIHSSSLLFVFLSPLVPERKSRKSIYHIFSFVVKARLLPTVSVHLESSQN